MAIDLRPLTPADARAHNAGEDAETIRWLNGAKATIESTTAHFARLAHNTETGHGARGFGVWFDGRLAGYVECNPDVSDGVDAGDVNISYAVHPWARGRGIAVEAVGLICEFIRANNIGSRAAIRVDPSNHASVRVAQKCGFTFVRDFVSTTDTEAGGAPKTLSVYVLAIRSHA